MSMKGTVQSFSNALMTAVQLPALSFALLHGQPSMSACPQPRLANVVSETT
jgi:hypothetical protein